MTTDPNASSPAPAEDAVDLDELFRDAPVLTTPHDLAAPDLFPDDAEFDEFLSSIREDRGRDLA